MGESYLMMEFRGEPVLRCALNKSQNYPVHHYHERANARICRRDSKANANCGPPSKRRQQLSNMSVSDWRPRPLSTSLTWATSTSSRRIRCDETRPVCNKCSASGRSCQWWSWVVTVPDGHWGQIQQSPSHEPLHPLRIETPRQNRGMSIDSRQRMAVEFFGQNTRHLMTRRIPPNATLSRWADYIMASCVNEPAVRCAVGALGSVHQGTVKAVHTSLQRPMDKEKWELTIEFYLKALSHLQRLVQRATEQPWLVEPTLACCTLVFVLELYMGNDGEALRHSRFGRRILQQHLRGSPPVIGSTMQLIFVGLSLAGSDPLSRGPCALGYYSCAGTRQMQNVERMSLRIPDQLQTKESIGQHLEHLIRAGNNLLTELHDIAARRLDFMQSHRSMAPARRYCLIRSLSRSISLRDHADWERRIDDTVKAHQAWRRATRAFLQNRVHTSGLIMIQLRCFISYFNLETCRTSREMDIDQYSEGFNWALNLVDEYFATRHLAQITVDSAAPVVDQPHNVGIFDFSMLSALMIVSTKCRDSALRQRATRTLERARRRERIYSIDNLQRLADGVVELEAEGTAQFWQVERSDTGDTWVAGQVPEHVRFSDVVISMDENDSEATCLVCAYSVRALDGSIRILQTTRVGDGFSARHEMQYQV